MSIWQIAQIYRGDFVTFEQERLRQARTAQGLSQRDIAALLEVSQPAYQKLENGQTTDMRISTLKRLCKVLKVSADWLLGIDEEESPTFYMKAVKQEDGSYKLMPDCEKNQKG